MKSAMEASKTFPDRFEAVIRENTESGTLAEFVRGFGADYSATLRWRYGHGLPSMESLLQMWQEYDIDLHWLLTGAKLRR